MAHYTLTAHKREITGKGAARKLRRDNQIPAVFYGPKSAPIKLAVDYAEMQGLMKNTSSGQTIIGLQIKSNGESDTKTVMLKELQVDPIKDIYLHADFYEISMDQEVTIDVPIRLMGIPQGVTDGGVLQHIRRQLSISCLPDKLVEAFEIDVSELNIGDSLHISDIALPEGITSMDEEHLTVAVVAAPTVVVEEEPEEEEEIEEGEEGAAEAEEGEAEAESSEES